MKNFEVEKPCFVAACLQHPEEGRAIDLSRLRFNPCFSRFVVQKWHITNILHVSRIDSSFYFVETEHSFYYLVVEDDSCIYSCVCTYQIPKKGEIFFTFPFLYNTYSNRFMIYSRKSIRVKEVAQIANSIYVVKDSCDKPILVRTI